MLKKAITVSVVVLTIFWAVGLAAFVPVAQAAYTPVSGDLIKSPEYSSVFYVGADAKRYTFPNEKVYKSWYTDFSTVKKVDLADLQKIGIGGNVTYRPGFKLVKFPTDPKIYAVAKGGVLRWIKTGAAAEAVYGTDWAKKLDDINEVFYNDYGHAGVDINGSADYNAAQEMAAVPTINVDKGLSMEQGSLNASLDASTPAAASVPANAANVSFTVATLKTGAAAVTLTGAAVERTGLSTDADLAWVKLFVDGVQLGTSQTLNSQHKANFTFSKQIAANTTVKLTLAADINPIVPAVVSDQIGLKLVSLSGPVASGLPVLGNQMTISGVAIGTATILQGGNIPSTPVATSIDPDVVDYKIDSFKIQAGSEDLTLTQITAYAAAASSLNDDDISKVKLINEKTSTTLGETTMSNGMANFSNLNVFIGQGTTVEFSFAITLLGGSGRQVGLDFSDGTSYSVMVKGNTYGFGINPIGGGAVGTCWNNASVSCGVFNINQGTLAINKNTAPATGNVPLGGESVPLASYQYQARGEGINVTHTEITLTPSILGNVVWFTNIVLVDENNTVVAGPKAGSAILGAGVAQTFIFTDSYTVPVGDHVYTLKANISSGALAGSTINASMAPLPGTNGRGEDSGKWLLAPLPPAALITGNVQTLLGPALAVVTAGVPINSTFVVGEQNVALANLDLDPTAGGEPVKVTSIKVTDTWAGATINDLTNFEIWGDPDTTDTQAQYIRIETSGDTSKEIAGGPGGTVTFNFKSPLKVSNGSQNRLTLVADVSAAVALPTHNFTVVAVGDVNATGWLTGAAVVPLTVSGAATGSTHTLAANGSFYITASGDMPASKQLASGITGNEVAKYKLTSVLEPVDVTILQLQTPASNPADIGKVYLYLGTTLLGSTTGYAFDPATDLATISLGSGTLVVPKDSTLEITLKFDMAAKANITSNDAVDVAIYATAISGGYGLASGGDYEVYAVGQASGVCFGSLALGCASGNLVDDSSLNTGLGDAYQSNAFSAHRGTLSVALASDTPSGNGSGQIDMPALKFVLSATSDTVWVNDIEFSSTGIGAGMTGGWALKEDKTSGATYARGVAAGLKPGTSVSASAAVTVPYVAGSISVAPGAANAKKYAVLVNTTGAIVNDSISINIMSNGITQTGIEWYDSYITPILLTPVMIETFGSGDIVTDGLPLNGKTIKF